MTCRDFAEFMGKYLAGELPAGVLAAFEHHVAMCPNCERYLAQYRDSIVVGRAAFGERDAVMPAEVPADLIAAILTAHANAENAGRV
jgi:anti-sigma factor RsiW